MATLAEAMAAMPEKAVVLSEPGDGTLDAVMADAAALFGYREDLTHQARCHAYLAHRRLTRGPDEPAALRAVRDLCERARAADAVGSAQARMAERVERQATDLLCAAVELRRAL